MTFHFDMDHILRGLQVVLFQAALSSQENFGQQLTQCTPAQNLLEVWYVFYHHIYVHLTTQVVRMVVIQFQEFEVKTCNLQNLYGYINWARKFCGSYACLEL